MVVQDDDTEVLDHGPIQLALLQPKEKVVFPEPTEHLSDDLMVTGEVRMHDEDVIQVDHDVSGQNQVLEDVVHHCLEGGWGVGKAKVHHQQLEEPSVRTEHGLPFVTFPNPDVVETPPDVELCEELGSFQLVK
jgi:hypothetical protein